MSDRQKLVYDLAMQAAVLQLQSREPVGQQYHTALLEAFASNVWLYQAMLPDQLDAVLDQLKTF